MNKANSNMVTLNYDRMMKGVESAGGVFYQYRACRRNSTTIYDIENIRHGVVYSQTPLNMNDPFDSMIGFSAEAVYEEAIEMALDMVEIDGNIRLLLSLLLKSRVLNKIADLIGSFREIRSYLVEKQHSMHMTTMSLEQFIQSQANTLYRKLPKKQKAEFSFEKFYVVSLLVATLGDQDITEKSIIDFLNVEDELEILHKKVEEVRDKNYFPAMKEFLSQLTISCFSASGWDNQLMWAHYANSYRGICVEYDFTRIKEFIGFIYPVSYSGVRPTISLKDMGITEVDRTGEAKVSTESIDYSKLIGALLVKNNCWSYEEEWRIINIGQANTPRFIDLPFVKSVTFGVGVDEICKRLLIDVCKERGIGCYELVLDKERFELSRRVIDEKDIEWKLDEEVEFIKLLFMQIADFSEKVNLGTESFAKAADEGDFDKIACKMVLSNIEDALCSAYFLKMAFWRMFNNFGEEVQKEDIPDSFFEIREAVDNFVATGIQPIIDTKSTLSLMKIVGKINDVEYRGLNKHITNIEALAEKMSEHDWHFMLKQGK